jgi:hypothetical protein
MISFNAQPVAQEGDTITATCGECGMSFLTKTMQLFDRVITPSLCNQCADKRDTRMAGWCELCPLEFRTPDEVGGRTRLDILDQAAPQWRKVLVWNYHGRGLLIRGETGRCKTRAMWRLLRRLFDEHRKIRWMTAAEFDRQCRDAGGSFTLTRWFKDLKEVDIFFLDDLGKGSWTHGTEGQFFDLVDTRTREGRPILITCNDNGASLADRLSADRGVPLVRRLRDYCECVVL